MTDAASCPDSETLAAYVDGRLGGGELQRISAHLIDCDHCYESVAATVRFLSGGGSSDDINPRWALAPALVTASVMALVLTVCLVMLGHTP